MPSVGMIDPRQPTRENIEPSRGPRRIENVNTAINDQAAGGQPESRLISKRVETAPFETTETFNRFYAANYETLVRSLSITLNDVHLGTEAADEAMARALANWSQIDPTRNPTGWAYRAGLNWARSWQRKVARRLPWTRDPVELPDPKDLELQRALGALDLRFRSVVVCRYLLDWSTDETAEALDIAAGTVKSRLSTGLAELRRLMDTPTQPIDITPPGPSSEEA